jgi:hypothetical protein
MKITAFYYLQYPDCAPHDPFCAASEVYVEVASSNGDINSFDFTYALTVCTVGYIKKHLESQSYYANRAVIVVDRFDDQVIRKSLESVLPHIDELAIKR